MTEHTGGSSPFDDADLDLLIEENVFTGAEPEPPSAGPVMGGWKLETFADAYADTEPTKFLVEGLLPLPSLSIVFGGPGSLKSMLLADMAVCIAGGVKWLESMPEGNTIPGVTFVVHQAPVLWVDFDNGRRRTRERIAALGRGHDIPSDSKCLSYVSMPTPWLDASDITIVSDLANLVRKHGFKLIVIDNLGLISGDIDENSGEMAQVMGHLRWLSEDCECAVIVVHHQRKTGGNSSAGDIPKAESLRGHSSINASLDLALLIERRGREDAVSVVPTKVRDYQEFDTFGAIWTYQHSEDSKRLHAARFFSRAVATPEEAVNIAIKAVIKNELRGKASLAAPEIVQMVRDRMAAKPGGKAPAINKIRGLVTELAEDGELLREGKARNLVYRLP